MTNTTLPAVINRIASLDAGDAEFTQFEALAAHDPGAWEQLARTLRDEMHMRAAVSDELDGAAGAEIVLAMARRHRRPAPPLRVWGGWAVAALVALSWVFMARFQPPAPPNGATFTPVLAALSADEALERYLRAGESEGRILAELPAVMLESRRTEDGRLEVIFVRQLLERDEVTRVYELASDEHGLPQTVPVDLASYDSSSSSL